MNTRKIFSFLAAVFVFVGLIAQRHEIGFQLGTSNLVGDIGKTRYINPFPNDNKLVSSEGIPFYGGLLYRFNFNPYQTIKLSLGYGHIQFNDHYTKEDYKKRRGLSGTNTLYQIETTFEYNFFPANAEQRSLWSPYVFAGFGAMLYGANDITLEHNYKRNSTGQAITPTSSKDFTTTALYVPKNKLTFTVPFGFGLKYKYRYDLAFFIEATFRPTFSDEIDYSVLDKKDLKSTYNKDILYPNSNYSLLQTGGYLSESETRAKSFLESKQVGNPHSKDWVNSLTLGFSYSFGRPPCYCD